MAQISVKARTTAPIELRFTQSGKAVGNIRAVENHYERQPNGEWQQVAETFHRITVWDRLAEDLAEVLTDKGVPILVMGEQKTRKYEKQDGTEGTSLEITAKSVGLIPTKKTTKPAAQADPWTQDTTPAQADQLPLDQQPTYDPPF